VQVNIDDALRALRVPRAERGRLGEIADALAPERLGAWLAVADHGLDGGWVIDEPTPLSRAWVAAPESRALDRVMDWAELYDVTMCLRVRRSVGAGTPWTELVLEVPGDAAPTQFERADVLIRALGVAPLPAVEESWPDSREGPIFLLIQLISDGVTRIGALAREPSPGAVAALLRAAAAGAQGAAGAARAAEALARLEAALGTGGPREASLERDCRGACVSLGYGWVNLGA
jgi:hypothetical protein